MFYFLMIRKKIGKVIEVIRRTDFLQFIINQNYFVYTRSTENVTAYFNSKFSSDQCGETC